MLTRAPHRASRVCALAEAALPAERVSHMSQDPTGKLRPGAVTTAEAKERMRVALQTLLRARKIAFANTFVGDRALLVKQLRGYRYEFKQPNDAFGTVKRVLTGKRGDQQDDLAIALQLAIMWSQYGDERSIITLRV